jgi:PPM family protein phosphatase
MTAEDRGSSDDMPDPIRDDAEDPDMTGELVGGPTGDVAGSTPVDAGIDFIAAAATDVGLVREGNEDSFFSGSTVFAVADGMGGHVAGEIASSKALEPIATVDGRSFPTPEEAQEALVEAITVANTEVIAEGDADPSLSGMGTTLTAVLVRHGRLHLAHVGDSRAYLLRAGERISQLTTDHTLVEQLVREGRISREQAATHPQRSVITRAIGVDREVDVDSFPPLELQPGDQVLLCSDGLTGPVSDERISAILLEIDDAEEACAALIDAAKDGGAPDNVTVVLLRVEGDPPAGSLLAVDEDEDTGDIAAPPPAEDAMPTEDLPPPAPVRTSEGATPINTRAEPDPEASWAERMGRYGEAQGAEGAPPPSGRRGGRRLVVTTLVVVLALAILAGVGYALLSNAYFVGEDEGQVAIFRGTPQTVLGIPLYWVRETSDLSLADLPSRQADRVVEGLPVGSVVEGRETIENFRASAASTTSSPEPTPTPTPGTDTGTSPAPVATPTP